MKNIKIWRYCFVDFDNFNSVFNKLFWLNILKFHILIATSVHFYILHRFTEVHVFMIKL